MPGPLKVPLFDLPDLSETRRQVIRIIVTLASGRKSESTDLSLLTISRHLIGSYGLSFRVKCSLEDILGNLNKSVIARRDALEEEEVSEVVSIHICRDSVRFM